MSRFTAINSGFILSMDSIMASRLNWPPALLLSSLMSRGLYNLIGFIPWFPLAAGRLPESGSILDHCRDRPGCSDSARSPAGDTFGSMLSQRPILLDSKLALGFVIGISLGAPCLFRFRRKKGTGGERASIELQPRSAYLLRGPVRMDWQHSIPPVDTLRYSVTFRSLRESLEP
jgi:hypothetical protein